MSVGILTSYARSTVAKPSYRIVTKVLLKRNFVGNHPYETSVKIG